MITVNNKVLEVGDTAVFRNGGVAVVKSIKSDNVYFNIFKSDYRFYENGKNYYNGMDMLDIIDIIKAPEPETLFIELTYNKDLDENIACCYDSFEYLTECKDECNKDIAVLKVTMIDKKLISVEVVE